MAAVLVGHQNPPVNIGIGTLMEVASAYFARGMELTSLIQRGETEGQVPRGSKLYKFRTGELRSFLDIAKNATEMGSRRITVAQMESNAREPW